MYKQAQAVHNVAQNTGKPVTRDLGLEARGNEGAGVTSAGTGLDEVGVCGVIAVCSEANHYEVRVTLVGQREPIGRFFYPGRMLAYSEAVKKSRNTAYHATVFDNGDSIRQYFAGKCVAWVTPAKLEVI